MSKATIQLSPSLLGAWALISIARDRQSGVLKCIFSGKEAHLLFAKGRLIGLRDAAGNETRDPQKARGAARVFSLANDGNSTFLEDSRLAENGGGVDTLGDVLVALTRYTPEPVLDAFWTAHGKKRVEAKESFDKFMNAAVGLADQKAESAPEEPLAVSALLENKSLEMKRVWLGVIAMGGADFMEPVEEPPEQVTPLTDEERAQRLMLLALRNADRSSLDAEAIAVLDELLPIAERWTELTAYDLLNIAKDATTEAVQDAYFSYAKRLHSDVLRGMGLGQQILDVAETIFSQIGAAHKTLSDSDERSTYDFMMDRKARGLPTDVKIIMGAETKFLQAKAAFRRGQVATCEPILREVVGMNPGESEFWAYFGYAVYAAKRQDGMAEALAAIQKAIDMDAKLDVGHEFLGRIARVEGDLKKAKRHLEKALEVNPRNQEAARELQYVKKQEGKQSNGSMGGFLGKLLKR